LFRRYGKGCEVERHNLILVCYFQQCQALSLDFRPSIRFA